MIHDRDLKLSGDFDDVLSSGGAVVILTPPWAPRANAHAEQFVRTAREDCLDWLLILGRRHLVRLMVAPPPPPSVGTAARVARRDRLGGSCATITGRTGQPRE